MSSIAFVLIILAIAASPWLVAGLRWLDAHLDEREELAPIHDFAEFRQALRGRGIHG